MSHKIEKDCPACGSPDLKFIQKCKDCKTSYYVTEEVAKLRARVEKLERVRTCVAELYKPIESLGEHDVTISQEDEAFAALKDCEAADLKLDDKA